MQQPERVLPTGTKVRTHETLEGTKGMIIGPGNLSARRADAKGTIRGTVPGHGGDVYWVEHEGSALLAPYCFTEFDLDVG